jgi:hypothetical protein
MCEFSRKHHKKKARLSAFFSWHEIKMNTQRLLFLFLIIMFSFRPSRARESLQGKPILSLTLPVTARG